MALLLRAMFLGLVPYFALISVSSAGSSSDRIPSLIKALDDANVRYGASVALAKLGAKAVPALRRSLVLGSENSRVWSA